MRLSVLRLWISVGFALLGIQVALMVFVLLRTREELKEMRAVAEDLKKENDRIAKEVRGIHREIERLRRTPVKEDENLPPVEPVAGTSIDPTELVRQFRDAVIRDEPSRAQSLERKLLELEGRAVPAILSAIGVETSISAKAALYALLGRFTSRDGLAYLQRALLDERDRTVRLEIAAALARHADPTSMGVLTPALRDERDPTVRQAIMKAIAKIDTEDGAQLLVELYDTAAEGDRVPILTILSTMTRPLLKRRYERILDESKIVTERVLAVRGLGNLKDPTALARLETLKANDPEEQVRIEAERAIFKIRGN